MVAFSVLFLSTDCSRNCSLEVPSTLPLKFCEVLSIACVFCSEPDSVEWVATGVWCALTTSMGVTPKGWGTNGSICSPTPLRVACTDKCLGPMVVTVEAG